MKKLYKRLLAVMLCLALTTAIVPVTAFAWNTNEPTQEELDYWEELGFVPGEVMVSLNIQCIGHLIELIPGIEKFGLCEQYLGDLTDLLPEIEIEEYKDSYLFVKDPVQGKTLIERKPDYVADLGKHFLIRLVDKTPEATEAAIEALRDNPYVISVDKNGCGEALDVMPDSPSVTVADALYVLRVAAGLITPELGEDLDKDGDGEVTVNDALIVLRIAAKLA